jgi:hypothetical protein
MRIDVHRCKFEKTMTYRILHLVRHGQMDPDPNHPDAHRNG